MKPNLVLFSLLFLTGATAPAAQFSENGRIAPGSVAVVELFTSQGCSSCPPADALLSAVGREKGVIALAYHVDYWNYIGWTDPFSKREWSERQRRYAAAFRSQQVYTPQLVVNGRTQVVGSNAFAVRQEIESALGSAPAVAVSLKREGARLSLSATPAIDGPDLELMIAICEGPLETPVKNGENGGRMLRNDFVVRSLTRATSFRAKRGNAVRAELSLTIDPRWHGELLSAVAFAQDPRTLRIYGGSRIPI